VEPEPRKRALQQQTLLARARQGDVDAFTTLLETRLEAMVRTATAILGDAAEARDATQEALVAIWRDLPALRDPARFDAWAGTILVNACRHALKRRARVRIHEIVLVAESTAGVGGAPLRRDGHAIPATGASEDNVAAADALERAFERLEADERVLLVMHHLEERPVAEIAARLGVPAGTAKSRLHAARRSLKRALEREWQ
jgi:RNA polymerase sigma-70 factor (ECF subfamily)